MRAVNRISMSSGPRRVLFCAGIALGLGACCDDGKKHGKTDPRREVAALSAPNGGRFGVWSLPTYCPTGTFATGFRTRVEASQGSKDDTGLNAIELLCRDLSGQFVGNVLPAPGPFGEWGARLSGGSGALLTGFRLRAEADQGDGDDTAADSVGFFATPFGADADAPGEYLEAANGIDAWGTQGEPVMCPEGSAICGLEVRVEPELANGMGNKSDDTALNDLRIHCCEVVDRAPGCRWDACGLECVAEGGRAAVEGDLCIRWTPDSPDRCGRVEAPLGEVPRGEACRITLSGGPDDPSAPKFEFEQVIGPGEVVDVPDLDGGSFTHVESTAGPCRFDVYGKTEQKGAHVAFGSELTGGPLRIGREALQREPALDAFAARSLRIVGARIDAGTSCRIDVGDLGGGFALFDDADDVALARFVRRSAGRSCQFRLDATKTASGEPLYVYGGLDDGGLYEAGIRSVRVSPFDVQALDADSCALDAECDTPAEPDETQGGFEPDSECIACACPRN